MRRKLAVGLVGAGVFVLTAVGTYGLLYLRDNVAGGSLLADGLVGALIVVVLVVVAILVRLASDTERGVDRR